MLKRLGLFAFVGMMVMLLVACGGKQSSTSNKEYDNSISKGLDAVAEDKMDKAVTYFTNALDQKPKDAKATAYLKQAKAYVDTNKQLNEGEPEQAVKTVTVGTKVKNGAKSIKDKLDTLLKTATADWKEYQQIDKDISAQLKSTTPSQDVVKQVQAIDWPKKPYLKNLKAKADELIKKAKAQTDKANTTSSSQTSQANDAKSHAQAEDLRQGIVSSMGENSGYTMAGLETVPDKVIVDLSHQGEQQSLDIGWLGEELARRYPNIKTQASQDTLTAEKAESLIAKYQPLISEQFGGDMQPVSGAVAGAGGIYTIKFASSSDDPGMILFLKPDGTVLFRTNGGTYIPADNWK